MIDQVDILAKAKAVPERTRLEDHAEAIAALRDKKYTWREIATFLNENGIETDHTKVYRFMQRIEDVFIVPVAADYARVLLELSQSKNKLVENQMKMLEKHYLAHNRTITYTELAKAVGSDDYRTANSQYGSLGKTIGEALGLKFEKTTKGQPFFSGALCVELQSKSALGHTQVMMHHELAKAIGSLGWFM